MLVALEDSEDEFHDTSGDALEAHINQDKDLNSEDSDLEAGEEEQTSEKQEITNSKDEEENNEPTRTNADIIDEEKNKDVDKKVENVISDTTEDCAELSKDDDREKREERVQEKKKDAGNNELQTELEVVDNKKVKKIKMHQRVNRYLGNKRISEIWS